MANTKAQGYRFIPVNLMDEEPNWPTPCKPSLASKLFVSRFGFAPDTAITIAGLVGLPQIEER
jgi:hypothetical protein